MLVRRTANYFLNANENDSRRSLVFYLTNHEMEQRSNLHQ